MSTPGIRVPPVMAAYDSTSEMNLNSVTPRIDSWISSDAS